MRPSSTATRDRRALGSTGETWRNSCTVMPAAAAWIARIGPPWETTRTVAAVVGSRDAQDGREHAGGHLLVRLAVLPAVAAFDPAAELGREALLHLDTGEAGPGADVDLAQAVVGDDLETAAGRDGDRRVERAPERARVDRLERDRGQLAREHLRLLRPRSVSGRSTWPWKRFAAFQSL